MPERYIKKPVEIEAIQLTRDNAAEITKWIVESCQKAVLRGGDGGGSKGATVLIKTLEGTMHADHGDFVIRGIQGEFYPCKPDIFEATYEPLASSSTPAAQAGDDRG